MNSDDLVPVLFGGESRSARSFGGWNWHGAWKDWNSHCWECQSLAVSFFSNSLAFNMQISQQVFAASVEWNIALLCFGSLLRPCSVHWCRNWWPQNPCKRRLNQFSPKGIMHKMELNTTRWFFFTWKDAYWHVEQHIQNPHAYSMSGM